MNNNLITNNKTELLAGNVRNDGYGNWLLNKGSILLASFTTPYFLNFIKPYYNFAMSFVTSNSLIGSRSGLHHGGSVGLSVVNLSFIYNRQGGQNGGYITGNGTNWTQTSVNNTSFSAVSNTVSDFTFNIFNNFTLTASQQAVYWKCASARYAGTTANRAVIKITSGLGAATFGFRLVDTTTGLAVASNSANDLIELLINTSSQPIAISSTSITDGIPFCKIYFTGFMEL